MRKLRFSLPFHVTYCTHTHSKMNETIKNHFQCDRRRATAARRPHKPRDDGGGGSFGVHQRQQNCLLETPRHRPLLLLHPSLSPSCCRDTIVVLLRLSDRSLFVLFHCILYSQSQQNVRNHWCALGRREPVCKFSTVV